MWVFFFLSESGSVLTFPLEIGFSRKAILKNPQKAKAVHIVFVEYFLPVFKLKQQKKNLFWNNNNKKKNQPEKNIHKTMILKTEQSVSD